MKKEGHYRYRSLINYPYPLDRSAVILSPRKPFVEWILRIARKNNECNSVKEPCIKKEAYSSKSVFLIPHFDKFEECENYLRRRQRLLFEQILWERHSNESLWPRNRSWQKFKNWFDYEIHASVCDVVGSNSIDREMGRNVYA